MIDPQFYLEAYFWLIPKLITGSHLPHGNAFFLFVTSSACLPTSFQQQIFIESTYHVLGASWRK